MRAFSKKAGVSVATLSKVINGKKALSPYHAHLILSNMNLPKPETEAFMERVFLEYKQDFKNYNDDEDGFLDRDFLNNIQEIKLLKKETTFLKTYVYQIENKITQRTLVLLKEKKTGNPSPHFIDVFVDTDREVAATAYFFKNEDNTYRCLICSEVNRFGSSISQRNMSLKVSFSPENLPSITDIYIDRDRKEEYDHCNLVFTSDSCTYQGNRYNRFNQEISNVSHTYFRVT